MMRCPFCKKELIVGKMRLYQTGAEHVMDPNCEYDDPGERITYECTCIHTKNKIWWSGEGELYVEDFDMYDSMKFKAWIKHTEALDSQMRMISIAVDDSMRRNFPDSYPVSPEKCPVCGKQLEQDEMCCGYVCFMLKHKAEELRRTRRNRHAAQ